MTSDEELQRIRAEKEAEIVRKMGITIQPSTADKVIHIANQGEWQNLLERARSKGLPIAIDFSATWCMPCKFFAPIFQKIQSEFGNSMYFVHVDIDEFPDLPNGFGVTGVPTTSIIFGDKEIERQVGAAPEPAFRQMVQRALQKVKR